MSAIYLKSATFFVWFMGYIIIRLPDLRRIIQLTQPTTWRIVERLRASGVLRVEQHYRDHVAGARAHWIQPMGSADLSDAERVRLIEIAELIREYRPLWSIEQYQARVQEQGWRIDGK